MVGLKRKYKNSCNIKRHIRECRVYELSVCTLTSLLHICGITSNTVLFFFFYLSEDGPNGPKNVSSLPHIFILLFIILV
jgi:hypothetical protein